MRNTLRLLLVGFAVAVVSPMSAYAQSTPNSESERRYLPHNITPNGPVERYRFSDNKYVHKHDRQREFSDNRGEYRQESHEYGGRRWNRFARYGRHPDRAERFLRRFDKNGDGKVTRREFGEATMRRFNRIDADQDGTISMEELSQRRNRS